MAATDADLARATRQRYAALEAAGAMVEGIRFELQGDDPNDFCRSIHGRSLRKAHPLYRTLRAPFHDGCGVTIAPVLRAERRVFDEDWHDWVRRNPLRLRA